MKWCCACVQVVGVTVESEGAGRASVSFTPAEEEKFLALSRTPDIYEKMASSISPSISGDYTVDIKKALACLLFGGSRKVIFFSRAEYKGKCNGAIDLWAFFFFLW